MRIDIDAIAAAIGELGSTADEVAAALAARGIKGRRDVACDCPLANYLKSVFPSRWRVNYYTASWDYRAGTWYDNCIVLPPVAQDFLCAFDDGHYPFLDTEES